MNAPGEQSCHNFNRWFSAFKIPSFTPASKALVRLNLPHFQTNTGSCGVFTQRKSKKAGASVLEIMQRSNSQWGISSKYERKSQICETALTSQCHAENFSLLSFYLYISLIGAGEISDPQSHSSYQITCNSGGQQWSGWRGLHSSLSQETS